MFKIAALSRVMVAVTLSMYGVAVYAQQTNKPATMPSINPTVHVGQNYTNGVPVNLVRTWEATAPITDANAITGAAYKDARQTTQYIDGLGRPLQTVSRQITPQGKDMVLPVEYDLLGREVYKYQPYVSTENNGAFKMNPFSAQPAFYQGWFTNQGIVEEQVYYSQTNYEPSPLSRVSKTMAPGNSWVGSNRGVSNEYMVNEAGDAVRIWNITSNLLTYNNKDVSTNIPFTSEVYNTGELYKNVTTDEAGSAVVEYKDKEGQVVLKKVQSGNLPAGVSAYTGYTGFLCSYYVYDDLNQLRFVIPPKAVALLLNNNWQLTADMINELCFRYEYDEKKRMTGKKAPGADWVYMIYDERDRLVFTQDGNQHNQGQWLATLYDVLNRPVVTGLMNWNSGDPAGLQGIVTAQTIADANTTIEGVSINRTPIPSGSNFTALTKTFYDNYSWTGTDFNPAYNTILQQDAGTDVTNGYNLHPVDMPAQKNIQALGLVTGTQVRVIADPNNLSAGNWLTTVNFYDDRNRIIQINSETHKGRDIVTNRYDFTGKLLVSYLDQNIPTGTPTSVHVKTIYAYDHGGRLMEMWKSLNDNNKILIAKNEYNELGQLLTKELGHKKDNYGNYTTEALEKLNYSYNIRGWLTGINKDYANNRGIPEAYFGMELNYDKGFLAPQYNGNIAGTIWRSKGDGQQRAYGYTYDKANRLMGADFTQFNGSGYDNDPVVNFDMFMGVDGLDESTAYDENGNIKAMKQWGLQLNNSPVIDDLHYSYFNNGNKLSSVSDAPAAGPGMGDFTDNNSGDDYGYDKNGNLVTDLNKRINGSTGIDLGGGGAIIYNHLNLPWQVTVKTADGLAEKGKITYVYDAAGNKLQKIVEDKSTTGKIITTTTSYVGGLVYESKTTSPANTPDDNYADKLQFINQEEGRVRYIAAKDGKSAHFEYDYFLKDHLGNVRAVLTEQKDLNNYLATMEAGARTQENQLFDNLDVSQYPASTAGFPGGGAEEPNETVAHVNGNTQKKGPAIVLRVMAGDVVDIGVRSLFHNNTGTQSTVNLFTDILSSLAGGIVSASGVTKGTLADLSDPVNSPLVGALTGFRQDNNNDIPNKPKAYLNWMLVDEQFKYVNTFPQSGAMPVGAAEAVTSLGHTGIDITKNGYLYIYVSNETENWDVYFDDLAVTHHTGPLLEETHYYPFGLTMAGISSKALSGIQQNKRGFNGNELQNKEFGDGSGLEIYDFNARMYDPQIGRFFQVDPLSDLSVSWSPYAFASDNPINRNDPGGLKDTTINGQTVQRDRDLATVTVSAKKKTLYAPQSESGRFWRNHVNHFAKVPTQVTNVLELGANSLLRRNMVWVDGDLLDRVKQEPEIVRHQMRIVAIIKADPRFGKTNFWYSNTGEQLEFGGKRAKGEDWFGVSDENPLLHSETWDVAVNPLTWTLRHAQIQTDAIIKEDGTIIMSHYISDQLDLRPGPNHTDAYNKVTRVLGPIYHDFFRGNEFMQVRGNWTTTISN